MAEDLVIEWFNGGRNKPNRLTGKNLVVVKLLGGIWVFMWFVLTIPLFVDAQMKGRIGEDRAIPKEWSLVQRLMSA